MFGFDTGVISGALLYLKKDLNANSTAQEWIVSVLLLGAVLDAITFGLLAAALAIGMITVPHAPRWLDGARQGG